MDATHLQKLRQALCMSEHISVHSNPSHTSSLSILPFQPSFQPSFPPVLPPLPSTLKSSRLPSIPLEDQAQTPNSTNASQDLQLPPRLRLQHSPCIVLLAKEAQIPYRPRRRHVFSRMSGYSAAVGVLEGAGAGCLLQRRRWCQYGGFSIPKQSSHSSVFQPLSPYHQANPLQPSSRTS